ncbi:MAG: NAD(P)-binding domain-containing protein [Pseudomonadota bacterium]
MSISKRVAAVAAALFMVALGLSGMANAATSAPMKIGIIGTGNIGSSLATHWAKAGHELVISGLDPEALKPLAAQLGPKVRVGTPREAAAFGTVVLVSVPYKALPQVGSDYRRELRGKIVLDTGNPYPERDGSMAEEARAKGTGVTSKAYLPGTRLVRAFNAITYVNLRKEAFRAGARAAIPLASDDKGALAVASRLVTDAGFDPVIVGGLADARRFDVGSEVYVKLQSAAELRATLKLPQPK